MTLRLSVLIDANARGAREAFFGTRSEMDQTAATAKKLAGEAKTAATGIDDAAEASDRLKTAQKQVRDEARATLAQIVAMRDALAGYAAEADRAAARSAEAVNRRFGVRDDFGTAGREADISAWAKSRDDMRAKFDPMFAVQRTYLANLREIRDAERLGVLSTKEATAAIERQKAAFAATVQTMRAGGRPGAVGGSRGDAFRRSNIMAQNFDVFTSLAGGMNPALVAIQQGPQYIQAYGGVKETLNAVKQAATGARLALGGVAAVVVTGASAWDGYLTSVKAVETAMNGMGRGSGGTAYEIEQIAQKSAAAGGVSVKTARELEAALLRTGRVGVESFSGTIELAKDFAATIGTDVATAGQKLAGILADPGRGADQLRGMNLLDAATANHVRRLAEQNRLSEAQQLLLDGVRDRTVSAAEAATGVSRSWSTVKTVVSDVLDAIGRMPDRLVYGPKPEERLQDIDAEIERRTNGRIGRGRPNHERIAQLQAERAEIVKTIEAGRLKAQQERTDRENSAKVDAATGILGRTSGLEDRRRQLRMEIDALEARQRSGAAYSTDAGQDAELRRREAAALEAKRSALAGLIPESQRQAELDRIDLQIMTARDPVSRAALERRRAEVAAMGEESSAAEKAAQARNAYNKALGEGLATGSNRLADLREETAARAAVNDAVTAGIAPLGELDALMRQQVELRPLLIAHDKAEGQAKAELAGVISGLRNAYAAEREERARSQALQAIGAGRDDLERLQKELELVTAGSAARERGLAVLEAEQRIRATFGSSSVDNPEARQMRTNALAAADLRSELERTKQAYEDIKSTGGGAIDAVTQQIVSQSGSWKDVISGVLTDIRGQMATWAIANPLKNALFGSNLPTMQDAGGVLGRLFGGASSATTAASSAIASSTGMMTVSATTVIVNGGVAGGGAGLLAGKAAESVLPAPGQAATPTQKAAMDAVANDRVSQAWSGDWLRYSNQGATRSRPLDPRLVQDFAFLKDRGITMDVFSGGQAPLGSGGPRTGSTRHDLGNAADVMFYKDGRALDWRNPTDVPVYQDIVRQARANGVTGFGAGPGYMRPGSMHVGYGAPGVWGAGGRGANAPEWLRDAYGSPNAKPITPTPDTASIMAADKSLVSLSTSAQRADQNVTGFGGNLDQTAKVVASSATGVGGASKQLEQATAAVPGQAQGFFQTLLGGLGRGLDGLASGIGGFFSRLFGGGGATVAHTGAIIGAPANDNRPFSAGLFANAPRAHSGALLSGERALIAKVGEGVFTPKQMDNADKLISTAMQPRSLRVVDERPRTAAALAPPPPASSRSSSPGGGVDRVQIINPPGVPLTGKVEERRRDDGGRDIRVQLAEMVADDMNSPGSPTSQALAGRGVEPRPVRRGM